jgi:hypothetical protein
VHVGVELVRQGLFEMWLSPRIAGLSSGSTNLSGRIRDPLQFFQPCVDIFLHAIGPRKARSRRKTCPSPGLQSARPLYTPLADSAKRAGRPAPLQSSFPRLVHP